MLLFLLLGCPAGNDLAGSCGDTGACACEAASVEVGGGDVEFVPLTDGVEATMVHGPQGGWHILGGARMSNFSPIVRIHYTVTVEATGAIVADNNYRVEMRTDGECSGYYTGMYGYLDVRELAEGDLDTPPELLAGQELRLTMDVADELGAAASDSLLVIAALDPMDVE